MWAWPGGLGRSQLDSVAGNPTPSPGWAAPQLRAGAPGGSLTFEPALYPGPLQRSLGVYLIPAAFPRRLGRPSFCFTPTGPVLAPTTGLQLLRAGPGTATGSRPPGHAVLMAHSWLPGRSDPRSLAHTEPPASLPHDLYSPGPQLSLPWGSALPQATAPAWPLSNPGTGPGPSQSVGVGPRSPVLSLGPLIAPSLPPAHIVVGPSVSARQGFYKVGGWWGSVRCPAAMVRLLFIRRPLLLALTWQGVSGW